MNKFHYICFKLHLIYTAQMKSFKKLDVLQEDSISLSVYPQCLIVNNLFEIFFNNLIPLTMLIKKGAS